MKRLFRILYAYKNLFTFLCLEFVSLHFIFNRHFYEKIKQLNSSNFIIGNIYEFLSNIRQYPYLREDYKQILSENATLREQILQNSTKTSRGADTSISIQFKIIPAQVINNSIIYTKNYITINKGSKDGIAPGMGVMVEKGIVGRVKAVSEHFSTIISLLHTDVLISAQLVSSGAMGTIRWLGHNFLQAQLLYIPRHLKIEVGDQVVTSGYNSVFYAGIPIGQVSGVELNKESLFYDIVVDINTDFSTLSYVYVIENNLRSEKDSVESITKAYYE